MRDVRDPPFDPDLTTSVLHPPVVSPTVVHTEVLTGDALPFQRQPTRSAKEAVVQIASAAFLRGAPPLPPTRSGKWNDPYKPPSRPPRRRKRR